MASNPTNDATPIEQWRQRIVPPLLGIIGDIPAQLTCRACNVALPTDLAARLHHLTSDAHYHKVLQLSEEDRVQELTPTRSFNFLSGEVEVAVDKWTCMYECGFIGDFNVVSRHEATCSWAKHAAAARATATGDVAERTWITAAEEEKEPEVMAMWSCEFKCGYVH